MLIPNCLTFLGSYGITKEECMKKGCCWNEKEVRLMIEWETSKKF